MLEWEKVWNRVELLALCARQLQGWDEDFEEVRLRKQRKRMESKEYFDQTQQIRQAEIKKKDLVVTVSDFGREPLISAGTSWQAPSA